MISWGKAVGLEVTRRTARNDEPTRDPLSLPLPRGVDPARVDMYAVATNTPRYHRQVVRWALALTRAVPGVRARVLFADHYPRHLVRWLATQGIASTRIRGGWVHRSPYCLKIVPFLIPTDAYHVIVTDVDLYFTANPLPLLPSALLAAPPNQRAIPEWPIWDTLAEAGGPMRPFDVGRSVLPNPTTGSHDTPATNHSGGLVVMDARVARSVARRWLAWARWLTTQRPVLGRYEHHIDQIGLALAAHTGAVPLTSIPNAVNCILPALSLVDEVAGIHVASHDVTRTPGRVDSEGRLLTAGLAPAVASAVERLQDLHDEAEHITATLPDVAPRQADELPW